MSFDDLIALFQDETLPNRDRARLQSALLKAFSDDEAPSLSLSSCRDKNGTVKRRKAIQESKTKDKISAWKKSLRDVDFTCPYCLENISYENCQIDHFVPLSRGGKHEINNLCASCSMCNKAKSDTDPLEYIKNLVFNGFLELKLAKLT